MAKMEKIDLKNLSPREMLIMLFTGVFAIGFGYVKFEYEVQQKRIASVEKKIKQTDGLLATASTTLIKYKTPELTKKEMEKTLQRIDRVRQDIQEIKSKMVGKDIDILEQLGNEAELRGAILKSSKSSESDVTKGKFKYKNLTLKLKIQSDYLSLGEFIAGLEQIPAIISLTNVNMLRKESILPMIETQIKLTLSIL